MASSLGVATLQTDVDLNGLDKGLKQGKTKTSSFIDDVGKGFKQRLGMNVADMALQAGQAVIEFTKQSAEEFKQFEKGAAEVFTLLGDKADSAFREQMTDDILAFSQEAGRTTDDVIPALYQSISAGVPSENVFDFMKIASDAALGGVTDLETAVDGITSVVNAYGEEIVDAQAASDIMFTAVKLGKTDFEQLSSSLFNVVPTASSLGIAFEDVAANLAALTAQGTPTSVATTQMRAAFIEASKSGTKLSNAIKELSGKSFSDLIADGKTSSQIFLELRDSMPEQEFKDLFGSVEAMNAVLGLTNGTAQTVIGSFTDVEGATAEAAATMKDTAAFVDGEWAAAWEAFQITIGGGVTPVMVTLKKEASELIKVITNSIKIGQDLSSLLSKIKQLGTQKFFEPLNTSLDKLSDNAGVVGDVTSWMTDKLAFTRKTTEEVVVATDTAAVSFEEVAVAIEEVTVAEIALTDAQIAAADQYAFNTANVHDYQEASLEYEVTADQVAEAEKRREDATLAVAEAEQVAIDAENLRTETLGRYFEASLTATEQDLTFEQQLFNTAVAAGAGAAELAILAAATGDFTAEEIEAAFQAAVMQANIDTLVASMQSGAITAEEAVSALDQLKSGEATTAEQAIALSGAIDGANTQLDDMSGAAVDAAGKITAIPKTWETTYRLKVIADPIPRLPSGGGPVGQDQAFQSGGFTGFGRDDELAGFVHKNEVVIPSDTLRSGAAAVMDFVGSNVPNFNGGNGGGDTFNIDARGSNLTQGQIKREVEEAMLSAGRKSTILQRNQ